MTWAKFGVEYRGQLMAAGLTDAAARTHTDAWLWMHEIESAKPRIKKQLLRTIATTADYERAAKELVDAGFWRDDGGAWTLVHHAEVYHQSLAAQLKHRKEERDRQRAKRRKARSKGKSVGPNVGAKVGESQTDRQPVSDKSNHLHTWARARTAIRIRLQETATAIPAAGWSHHEPVGSGAAGE